MSNQREGWGHDSKLILKKTNYGKTVKKSHQKSFSKKDWNVCMRILLPIQFCSFHYTYSIYLGPNRGSSSKSWGYKTVQCYYPWYHLATLLIKNEFRIATLLIKERILNCIGWIKKGCDAFVFALTNSNCKKKYREWLTIHIKFKRAYIKVKQKLKRQTLKKLRHLRFT